MVEEINGGDNSKNSKNTNPNIRATHIHGRMEHNLAECAKSYFYGSIKFSRCSEFTRNIEYYRRVFLDISRHMLETSYILKLGQLLKIAPKLKRYLWQKLKQKKNSKFEQNNHKETS